MSDVDPIYKVDIHVEGPEDTDELMEALLDFIEERNWQFGGVVYERSD